MIQNSATVDMSAVWGCSDGSIGMFPSDTDADAISIHVSIVDKILSTGMEGSILTDELASQANHLGRGYFPAKIPSLGRDESDPATHADRSHSCTVAILIPSWINLMTALKTVFNTVLYLEYFLHQIAYRVTVSHRVSIG
jgi:hypothetical protein